MEYPTGIYIRGKQVKINLGNQKGKTVIFAGDRKKGQSLQLAKAFGMSPWLFRTMSENSIFVDDELKKYTLILPVSQDELLESDIYTILKETKKHLSKGQSMTVNDAKGIMESNTKG